VIITSSFGGESHWWVGPLEVAPWPYQNGSISLPAWLQGFSKAMLHTKYKHRTANTEQMGNFLFSFVWVPQSWRGWNQFKGSSKLEDNLGSETRQKGDLSAVIQNVWVDQKTFPQNKGQNGSLSRTGTEWEVQRKEDKKLYQSQERSLDLCGILDLEKVSTETNHEPFPD
jgi:hypothetical protein